MFCSSLGNGLLTHESLHPCFEEVLVYHPCFAAPDVFTFIYRESLSQQHAATLLQEIISPDLRIIGVGRLEAQGHVPPSILLTTCGEGGLDPAHQLLRSFEMTRICKPPLIN